ncbi:hypothetical protein [uncultured Methylobacterium sp.]|uniref:hypothetical protein n=1 Tax=uncultured Methylobacterium sp. TaxID=157278 RepID=UPI0035CA7504
MSETDAAADGLTKANEALSAWAARSAAGSAALIERLEALGYEVGGKSEDEIAEVLKHPPTRPGAA